MLKDFSSAAVWLIELNTKFIKVTPLATISFVLMSLFSQVALLLVSLLPLQILIVLGGGSSPRILKALPSQFSDIDVNTLVIALCGLTAVFAILRFIAIKLGEKTALYSVNKLLEKSQKIMLFNNQDTIASNAYGNYAEALAALLFAGLAITAISLIYLSAGMALISGLAAALLCTFIICSLSASAKNYVSNNINPYCQSLSTLGFIYILIFVIAQFLFFTPPQFIVAIVCVILSRQVFMRINKAIASINALQINKQKISALFFRNKTYQNTLINTEVSTWNLLEPDNLKLLIKNIFQEVGDRNFDRFNARWLQTSIRNLICLHITIPENDKELLVKLYPSYLSSAARHEASLLTEKIPQLPSPPFMLATKVNGFHCNVFDLTGLILANNMNPPAAKKALNNALLSIEPSPDLADRYCRSKQLLWQRVQPKIFDHLRLIAERSFLVTLNTFEESLPKLAQRLKKLPLCIILPQVNKNLIFIDEANNILYAHWNNWQIDIAGTGWDIEEMKLQADVEVVEEAKIERASFNNSSSLDIENSALLSAIETSIKQQRYHDTSSLLPQVLKRLDIQKQEQY